ncbi:hypothetical protein [Brevibacterium moorei]|uniref:hypothetical protein n=1 Tax=Brevibacterium moorei TaxID=2968457 RepID=UPI00211BD183|nr:hypothetical protein [Brevibacterium sp. 68QC2CO]MCQ9386805.1 hypothetical protein [Brevibacterium sp. 68QC2CO]
MIPCTTGHVLIIDDDKTGTRYSYPVIAWTSDGEPLIVGKMELLRPGQIPGKKMLLSTSEAFNSQLRVEPLDQNTQKETHQ